ncbi:MAG TPA: hypothetical protein VL358_05490 [Caulobacteraceae bacterium]|jgi:hypothetical protein|nr:hypothetical protein [Caulobacteraceae bacterium]
MPQLLKSPQAAQWASASLVVLASSIVGHQAAQGMDAKQWACAAFAVLGSVGVAVMVRVWPAPSKATVEQ